MSNNFLQCDLKCFSSYDLLHTCNKLRMGMTFIFHIPLRWCLDDIVDDISDISVNGKCL